jgi:hypothetical protein
MTYNFDMMISISRNLIVRLSNKLYGVGHLLLAGRSSLPYAVPLSSCLQCSYPKPSQSGSKKSFIKKGDRHFDAENRTLIYLLNPWNRVLLERLNSQLCS